VTSADNRSWFRPTLAALFLVSGASALIYQVLWLRLLGLIFGVTVYAASTVSASFMAGLALGSFFGGRLADRAKNPLMLFGAIEVLTGVTALGTPLIFDALEGLYSAAATPVIGSTMATTLIRLAMSLAVLIVPTTLMGATLPLIVKAVTSRSQDVGARTGFLYSANTAGAIFGTLLAGLLLVPHVGLSRTFWIAAAGNFVAGAVALALARTSAEPETGRERAAADTPALATAPPDLSANARRIVLWVFVVSGFATLALEVIWFRVIVLIARPTVYAFSLMLASVLAGIAIGSAIATPFLRRGLNRIGVLAALELALAFAVMVSLTTLNYAQTVYDFVEPALAPLLGTALAYPLAVSVPAVLPASILMGIAFPIGLQLWAGGTDEAHTASRVGLFYSLNVAGAIVGSLASAFVMLPIFGSRTSLILVAALIFASGLALVFAGSSRRRTTWITAAALTAGIVLVARTVEDPFRAYLAVRFPHDVVFWKQEAVQSTVSVHRQPGGRLNLHLEGNHQASDSLGMAQTHWRIGHLPIVLHPDPKDALVIGLGGGATGGAVALYPRVNVDIVELSPAVVYAARYFKHINHNVLALPNAHLRIDDGRNYLMLTDKRYDVITADIVLPNHAGANNLYAAEYFTLVKHALKPGGMFLQWLSGSDAEYKVMARTFQSVFPDATVWLDGSLFLGTNGPFTLSRSVTDGKLATPEYFATFRALGVETFQELVDLYRAGPDELRRFVGAGPILTDDRPLVEYFLSLPTGRPLDLSRLRGPAARYVVD
jgi:spermidine synthase